MAGIYSTVPLETITDLYRAGYSLRQISAKVGRSPQGIWQRLRRAGVVLRSRGSSTTRDPRITHITRRKHLKGRTTNNKKAGPS